MVLSIVYVVFIHFTIYNRKHNPAKEFIKYGIESNVSIFMGFQIANEDVFHDFGNLVI